MKILQEPNRRLHMVSSVVTNFNEAKKIAQELVEITRGVDRFYKLWIGMAAPQIGYNKRIILLRQGYKKYKLMVNPKIISKKWLLPSLETCYSLRGRGFFFLRRFFLLQIEYQDIQRNVHKEKIVGPRAYTFQQEMDHIDGLLISDVGKKVF